MATMNRRRSLALLGAGAATLGAPAFVRAQALPKIKVTTLPIEQGAQAFYAADMGFFTKAGLDVEIEPASSGDAAATAVASNAVDFGYADTVSIATAFGHGIPFIIVAPAGMYQSSAPTTALVVPNDSPIHGAKDLSGKVLAASALGTISGVISRAWIDRTGGDSRKVKLIELPFPAMGPALQAGRIDAAMVAEPFLTVVRKNAKMLASPYDVVAKEFLVGAWFTTVPWARAHPDLVNRFASAMKQSAVWANRNLPASGEVLLKHTKISKDVLAQMNRARYGETLDRAMIQPVIDVAAKYGKYISFNANALIAKTS